jgi:hypothetical protein
MSIFSGIKNRIFGRRNEDIGDIRSHVIGEPNYGEEPMAPIPSGEMPTRAEMPDFPGRFEREPLAFETPLEKAPAEKGGDYEIIDRLGLMEAQLSAIRSQTETINERLKNIEMRLGRRY